MVPGDLTFLRKNQIVIKNTKKYIFHWIVIGFGLDCQSSLKSGFGFSIINLQRIWIGLTIQKILDWAIPWVCVPCAKSSSFKARLILKEPSRMQYDNHARKGNIFCNILLNFHISIVSCSLLSRILEGNISQKVIIYFVILNIKVVFGLWLILAFTSCDLF